MVDERDAKWSHAAQPAKHPSISHVCTDSEHSRCDLVDQPFLVQYFGALIPRNDATPAHKPRKVRWEGGSVLVTPYGRTLGVEYGPAQKSNG